MAKADKFSLQDILDNIEIFKKIDDILKDWGVQYKYRVWVHIVIGVLFLIFFLYPFYKIFKHSKKRSARNELFSMKKDGLSVSHDNLMAGSAWGCYRDIYNIHLDVNTIHNMQDSEYIKSKELRLGMPCILIGDMGSGKTTLLRNLFKRVNCCKYYIIYNKICSRIILYFNARKLFERDFVIRFIELIRNAEYRRIYILCDGLDELENESVETVTKYINDIRTACYRTMVIFIIAGREKYIQNYLNYSDFYNIFPTQFQVKSWSKEQIVELVNRIGNIANVDLSPLTKNEEIFDIIQYNPMLCKMVCILHLDNTTDIKIYNVYELYNKFFYKLCEREFQKNRKIYTSIDIDKTLKDISTYAFNQYRKGIYKSANYLTNLRNIRVPEIGRIVLDKHEQFIHHSYLEFFVAYYYIYSLKNENIDMISILACWYNNAYADFISKGLLHFQQSDGANINSTINFLIYVYSLTMSDEDKNKLIQIKEYELKDRYAKLNEKFGYSTKILNNIEYLCVKYEIIFRLGRLYSSYPLPFLRFIYYDETFNTVTYPMTDYQVVVLKRQCAISSSFICGYDIEIDYATKMIPDESQYNEYYDLVNRSHTLIYYGDCVDKNIFNFKDDTLCDWKMARKKRIERLKQKVTQYCIDERKTCFRLFDLVTIYTFLWSRRGYELSNDEINTIIDTNITGIISMPAEREELMRKLKYKIINLLICSKMDKKQEL